MSIGERLQYGEINYSITSSTSVQVGFGLINSPYTSAVDQNYEENISIPNYITYKSKGYKVASIGAHAFYLCAKIKKVVIPETVVSFGWSCFNNMRSLVELIINPDNKMRVFGMDFLTGTTLSSFFIPSSVKEIEYNSFRYTSNIKFYYCGMRRFNDFNLTIAAAKLIYVSRNYPYESFGNIPVEKTLYCETHRCRTCNIISNRNNRVNILMIVILISS